MYTDFHLPDEWQQAAVSVRSEGDIALILGGSDSGKTTLLKYLIEQLSDRGKSVAVVDADLGQSSLGPPTAISGRILESPPDSLESLDPQEMFFVGATSPAGHLLSTVVGTKKLVEWAVSSSAPFVLVDTTGMVQGDEASYFKFHKIDLLRPRHLLVLQRSGELECLIRPFADRKSLKIYRLPVSPLARSRTQQERRAYREKRFRDYFRKGSVCLLPTTELSFVNQRLSYLVRHRGHLPRYLLVGFNDSENRTLALGIVQAFDVQAQEIFVHTPLTDPTSVRSIRLGSLRVDLSGKELGRWPA